VLLLGTLTSHSHVAGSVSTAHAGVGTYVISGAIMLAFAMARDLCATWQELAAACFSGFFTLGVGNGPCVLRIADSERDGEPHHHYPAVLDGGIRGAAAGRERLHAPTIGDGDRAGGASFLFRPDVGVDRNVLHGFLLLEVGWRGGVRVHLSAAAGGKAHPVIAGAVQQLRGLILAPFALAIHEHPCSGARAAWGR